MAERVYEPLVWASGEASWWLEDGPDRNDVPADVFAALDGGELRKSSLYTPFRVYPTREAALDALAAARAKAGGSDGDRAELLAFARDIAGNYDHEECYHRAGNAHLLCRRCKAEAAVAKAEGR